MVYNAIFRSILNVLPDLTAAPLKVYLALFALVGADSDVVSVSIGEIARLTHLNRRTVFRAIAALIERGLIIKQRADAPGPNRYRICALISEPEPGVLTAATQSPAAVPPASAQDQVPEGTGEPEATAQSYKQGCGTVHRESIAIMPEAAVLNSEAIQHLQELTGRDPDANLLAKLTALPNTTTRLTLSAAIAGLVVRRRRYKTDALLIGAVAYCLRRH